MNGDNIYYNPDDLSDASLSTFTLPRIDDAENPYFGMYTLSNGAWYCHKFPSENPADPGEGLVATSGFLDMGGQSYWSVSCSSDGNAWTIQADRSDAPGRSYLGYYSGIRDGIFYAQELYKNNIKLHDVSKLKPADN